MKNRSTWRRFSGEPIGVPLAEEIASVLSRERQAGHMMKVCIGTDSQVKGSTTVFATVIVFLRQGRGGFMYVNREIISRRMSVRQRMLLEVARSVEVAFGLCGLFSRYGVDLEVHADINTNPAFKSQEALKEAMGYILGMGFAFKAKPESFASSSCADRVVQ